MTLVSSGWRTWNTSQVDITLISSSFPFVVVVTLELGYTYTIATYVPTRAEAPDLFGRDTRSTIGPPFRSVAERYPYQTLEKGHRLRV
jgi:hypothetical protein